MHAQEYEKNPIVEEKLSPVEQLKESKHFSTYVMKEAMMLQQGCVLESMALFQTCTQLMHNIIMIVT